MAETGEVQTGAVAQPSQFDQLIAALMAQAQSQQALTADSLKAILAETSLATAGAMQKALKPENDTHPGVSVFSYPEGDVARPRPVLPFELLWNGYPVHKFPETQHWRELELMCQLKPGVYQVLRKDGTPMTVNVRGEHDANGKLTKVFLEHPILREERQLVPPQSVLLFQIVHAGQDTPRNNFIKAMQDHLLQMMEVPATVPVAAS